MFRYYTCGHGGVFSHHVLLDNQTILRIGRDANVSDLFCSVQTYDKHGVEQYSQLVFDIDNESIVDAYSIARSIQDEVMYEYDVDVTVWFSGSKGFHVVTGLVAYGETANIAMQWMAHEFSLEIDPAMYKSRSMFRLPNTINSKTGLYKIQVNDNESITSILNRANSKQPYTQIELKVVQGFVDKHAIEMDRLAKAKSMKPLVPVTDSDWSETLPPCIKYLLKHGIGVGHRWELCFWLVRHWRLCGIDCDEAISLADSMPVFRAANYTSGMIRHYYMNKLLGVGCRSGVLSKIMHENCDNKCQHSDGWGERVTGNFMMEV